jgi:hypothetical protein
MKKREKLLAAAAGVLVLLVASYYAVSRVRSSFTQRGREIGKLQKQITQKKSMMRVGDEADKQIAAHGKRSLPVEPARAGSAYRAWLLDLMARAGFPDEQKKVTALPGRPHGDIYTQFSFLISARANLAQLTRFLFEFYSTDHLHRIKTAVMQPIADSNDIDLTLQIEALSLDGRVRPNSDSNDELAKTPANRLKWKLDDYLNAICGRNCFSPPNKPPSLTIDSKSTYYDDETISFTAKARDPDKDVVKYSLGEKAPPGAVMDAQSGRFTFQPSAPGKYEFAVLATDDGLPAGVANHMVQFEVVKRPPPVDTRPQPPAFDPLKYAFLTGITEIAGRPEAWIYVRTEGRLLKLHEGDPLQVGAAKGVVARIAAKHVEFDAEGRRMVVALGQNLQQARPLSSGE